MTYVNDTDNSFILGKDGIWRKMEQIEYNITNNKRKQEDGNDKIIQRYSGWKNG